MSISKEIIVQLEPKLVELFQETDYDKFVSKLRAYNQTGTQTDVQLTNQTANQVPNNPNQQTPEEFWKEYDKEVERVNRWRSNS